MSQNSIVFVKLHCTVRATSIYELLLSSNCRPFYCLSCFASQLVITPLVPSNVWPMHCLFCFNLHLWLSLWYLQSFGHCIVCSASIYALWLSLWYRQTFGHGIVCPASIHSFWLRLRYLQTIGHSIICLLRFTSSDYPFVIVKRLAILLSVCFVSHLLITPLLSSIFSFIHMFSKPFWWIYDNDNKILRSVNLICIDMPKYYFR